MIGDLNLRPYEHEASTVTLCYPAVLKKLGNSQKSNKIMIKTTSIDIFAISTILIQVEDPNVNNKLADENLKIHK